MSQSGITTCPHCSAQFRVAAQAVGTQTQCLTCRQPFVIQLDLQPTPSQDPLGLGPSPGPSAANPLGTSPTTTLRPSAYAGGQTRRPNVPWSWIVGGVGGVALVVVVAIGAWSALSALRTGPGPRTSAPGILAPAPQTQQPAAEGGLAANVVKKAAETIAAELPVQTFSDSHASCLEESFRLQDESQRLGKQLGQGASGEAVLSPARALGGKMRELAIRWHALPPMTEAERELINKRLTERMQAMLSAKLGDSARKVDVLNDDTPIAAMFEIMGPSGAITDVLDAAREPFPDADCPLDELYVQTILSCREIVRQLNTVKDAADCQRLQTAVNEEAAKLKAAVEKVRGMKELTAADVQATERKYASQFAHEQMMAELVMTQVLVRAGHTSEDQNVPEHLKQLLDGLKQLYGTHYNAVHELRAEFVNIKTRDSQRASPFGQRSMKSPAERLKGVTASGVPALSETEEASVERYAKELEVGMGSKLLFLRVHGGTPSGRRQVAQQLVRHPAVRACRIVETSDGFVLVADAQLPAEVLARSAPFVEIAKLDENQRAVALKISGPFVAGPTEIELDAERPRSPQAGSTAQGGPRRSFDEIVAADVQRYADEFGPGGIVVVHANGGTAAQRKALEEQLASLANPKRRSKIDGKDVCVIILSYQGDVQELADKIHVAKVQKSDAAKREIDVVFQ